MYTGGWLLDLAFVSWQVDPLTPLFGWMGSTSWVPLKLSSEVEGPFRPLGEA